MTRISFPAVEAWWINPLAIPGYVAALSAAFFITAVAALTDFTYDAAAMNPPVFAFVVLILTGAVLARRGRKIGSAMEAMGLFSSLNFAAPFCTVILASMAPPLVDTTLANIDRYVLLGLNREKAILTLTHYPLLFDAVRLIYSSLLVQPWLLFVLLWATGQARRGWTFITAWSIALGVTLVLFALLPAMGAAPYFLDYMATLQHARDGSLRILGPQVLSGIITFPSFHAVAAVLLAWGFARVPRVGSFLVVWNVLMFASALVASHYAIDLVAGGSIAAMSLYVARRLQTRCATLEKTMLVASPHGSHALGVFQALKCRPIGVSISTVSHGTQ